MGWKDAPEVAPAASAAWMSAPEVDVKPTKVAPAEQPSFGQMLKAEAMTGPVGGLVRGVKDVIDTGAELLATGVDKVTGGTNAAGVKAMNEAGKADFKAAQELAGAGTSDVTRVGGQILATAPVGGVIAAPVKWAARTFPALTPFANALASSGMNTGRAVQPGVVNALKDLAIRVPAGAATGFASAGLVDPEQATTGAVVGGALPVALKSAGMAGNALGRVIRGPEQAADLTAAVQQARQAGYVIPPTQARPTLSNRLLEGFSGKLTTAQNASAKNAGVTNKLVAAELGLPADTKLTPDLLQGVRKQAGAAYEAIGNAGTITPGKSYSAALDAIAAPHIKAMQGFPNAKPSPVIGLVDELRAPNFDASSAVAKIKELRSAADDAFRAGNTDIARASRSAAGALEDAIEEHLAKGVAANSGVVGKATPPPAKGMVRLYRGESPTTGFHDVFKADGLQEFSRPPGMIGKRYTDELKVAEYYKNSYGRDAVLKYVDVPADQVGKYRVGTAEFIVDPDSVRMAGDGSLLGKFRDARKLIAKTYSVEKALNTTTGNVDARKLAAQAAKGKPLSGGIKEAADFAARFKTAANTPEQMGSLPQTSPLDWSLGAVMSGATMNPLAMASVMARPMARKVALSPVVQNRLAQQASQPNALAGLLSQSQLEQLGYQAAPVFAATGR